MLIGQPDGHLGLSEANIVFFVDAPELAVRDPYPKLLGVLLCSHPYRPEPLLL